MGMWANILGILALVTILSTLYSAYQLITAIWSSLKSSIEYSDRDILMWSQALDNSIEPITKTYEWRIAQWSGFGNTVLTATLAFASTVALAFFQDLIKMEHSPTLWSVIVGVAASLLAYGISQRRINRLKTEFIHLYNLLLLLK
jgi:hypothetical protein